MKVVIISQARMTSTRMPGKVMREVLGRPLLDFQIERLKRVRSAHLIVTATTVNPQDDPIVTLSERLGVEVFRGPEHDVLERYYLAARQFGADVVVRVTSDCPLNDPEVIERVTKRYLDRKTEVDFVNTALCPSYPNGIGAAAFSFKCLEEAFHEAEDPAEREHVTPFIFWRPERYRLDCVRNEVDCSNHRWTVDTPEDFELIRRIIETLYPAHPQFSWRDVLDLLRAHPDWVELNAAIPQKQLVRNQIAGIDK